MIRNNDLLCGDCKIEEYNKLKREQRRAAKPPLT